MHSILSPKFFFPFLTRTLPLLNHKKKPAVIIPAIIALFIFHLPFLQANALGAPRLMSSFLSDSNNASNAKPRATVIRAGEKFYFYYKVGPLTVLKGKGAPYRTRLVVKKGNTTVKDFGWHSANAANAGQMKRNGTLNWYHSVMWSLSIPANPAAGEYTAEITHSDLNNGANITVRYAYTVLGPAGKSAAVTAPPGRTIPVTGKVSDKGRAVPNTPVRAYLVSDLAQRRVVLVAETRTDARGYYRVNLGPDSLYLLKAGVDEHLWRQGRGAHGGTMIDLNFPEEARNADIPLENPR